MSARAGSRFSFGMIVFNGDFFLRQCLDGVYDFAHEIVVIEGADRVSQPFANRDGTSTDQTWEILQNYPDPKNKIRLFRGKFMDKDEQSNAFMQHLTGDFVWLLDSDEMYQPADMEKLARELHDDPELMAVEMRHKVFFGGLTRIAHGRHWETTFWRIHRLHPGARYVSHRPVNIMHPTSGRTLNEMKHLSADRLDDWGIRMYHYSYVLDRQVEEKIRYHAHWRPTKYPREKDVNYFHYDYLEKIWQPWKTDRERIEREYGISPQVYRDAQGNRIPMDRTIEFTGAHPPAMQTHSLYRATFEQSPRIPSPGNPGEGQGEGLRTRARQNPHPNPLPEYRARGNQRKGPLTVWTAWRVGMKTKTNGDGSRRAVLKQLARNLHRPQRFSWTLRPIDFLRYREFDFALRTINTLDAKPKRVLDLSSPKLLPLTMASSLHDSQVVSTDILDHEVHWTRMKSRELGLHNLTCEAQDARKLPYPSDSFDLVTSVSVFEHIAPEHGGDIPAIREMHRVLRPAGVAILTVPASRKYLADYLAGDVYERHFDGQAAFFQRFYTPEMIQRNFVELSGLNLVDLKFIEERYYFRNPRRRIAHWFNSTPTQNTIFGPLFPLLSHVFLSQPKPLHTCRKPYIACIVLRKHKSALQAAA